MRLFFRTWPATSLAALVLGAAAVGCASAPPGSSVREAGGLAVIGLTRREGVEGINRGAATADLLRRLEATGRRVVGPERVSEALGATSHAALLARHARDGLLFERDLRLLAAAPLDTPLALLVRVERDEVIEAELGREPAIAADGRSRPEREIVERATWRDMTLSAVLVDRVAGRTLWRRVYRASPVTRAESVRYRGDSFASSVAAVLANRLAGATEERIPPPAPRRATLNRLFDGIERSLPEG